jgi:hypothetical protein
LFLFTPYTQLHFIIYQHRLSNVLLLLFLFEIAVQSSPKLWVGGGLSVDDMEITDDRHWQ